MEQGLGTTVLFTPHLAPMVRGILATCYARPGRPPVALTTEDAMQTPARAATTTSPSSWWPTPRRRPRRPAARTPPTSPVRVDPRTGWVVVLSAIDNLVKGAAGQAVQCANLALGLPEAAGLPVVGGVPVSITTPAGFVAAGLAARHQGVRGARPGPAWPPRTARPVPTAATFTSNLAAAAPVQVSRAHLAATGGRAAAVLVSSGNANAATGDRGRADADAMCALAAEGLGCRGRGGPGVLDRADRHPAADGADRGRASRGWWPPGPAGPPPAPTPPPGILTTDSGRKEVLVEYPTFTVAGMAKGAGMLAPNMATMLAFLTTDAAVEPGPLADILRSRGGRLVQLDVGRRVHLDQRHGGADGLGSGRRRRPERGGRRRGRGLRRPGRPRWRPTPRGPTRSSRSR